MRTLYERLGLLAAVLFVALAVSQAGSPTFAVATIAVIALATAAAVAVVPPLEVTVGARARAHREVLSGMPEPRHPSTAGRPLGRAPTRMGLAAQS